MLFFIVLGPGDTLLTRLRSDGAKPFYYAWHSPRVAAHAAFATSFYYRNVDTVTFIILIVNFCSLPNDRMINYDYSFNVSSASGVEGSAPLCF